MINKYAQLSPLQKEQILRIWNAEYPINLQYTHLEEFEKYLQKIGQPRHFIIQNEQEEVCAWLATFNREGERWIVMLIDDRHQGKKLGSKLLDAAKMEEATLNAWVTDHLRYKKADGHTYPSPVEFYLKNDFVLLPDIRLENEVLSSVKMRWSR